MEHDVQSTVRRLRELEEQKLQQASRDLLLQITWSAAAIHQIRERGLETELKDICKGAFDFEVEDLYLKLTQADIAPFDDESADEQVWIQFKKALCNKNSPIVLTASLRFFRAGEFEHLWKEDIVYLLRQAEMIPTKVAGLGSITRIVWNQSEDMDRPKNLLQLLELVWAAFLEEVDEDQDARKQKDKTRVGMYLKVLKNAARAEITPFQDKNVWTEHVIRNLLRESLANDLEPSKRTVPTKLFCLELEVSEQPFLDALL
eukprot:TRINITY_DN16888_c0_g2_i1.p2 TRINITY_DN16888_c0_g2~~TRINITY_DN16888_c0_g2_i1.p2  ORF type:complete len:260 (+),score=85.79 TRINITY_DN16888_c0_g2_i1:78-857(+)